MPARFDAWRVSNETDRRSEGTKQTLISSYQAAPPVEELCKLTQLTRAKRAIDIACAEIVASLRNFVIPRVDGPAGIEGEGAVRQRVGFTGHSVIAQQSHPGSERRRVSRDGAALAHRHRLD